jgi:heme oxygenase (biliverdin-IX-beta and delta-forming)
MTDAAGATEPTGVTGPAPLSTLLRDRTRASHERTEAAVGAALDLAGPGPARDRYARLLERWYGFEATWARHAPVTLAALGEDYFAPRRKLPLLAADLHALGRGDADLAALPTLPAAALPLADPAAALGVLYVVEGSTLGGQHVAKAVACHTGLTPDRGLAYFASYGPDVGRRWRETKALLDAPPLPADPAAVVAGAVAAFDLLHDWLTA